MRLHLTFALLTVVLLVITLHAKEGRRFNFAQVDRLAFQRAQAPYAAPPNALPPQLKNLTPQQEAGIFWKDVYRLWHKKGLPFQVDFYHISKMFPSGPRINTVDHKGAHPLAYSPAFFQFENLDINPPLPATLPYAGFYLRYPIPTAGEPKPSILNGFFSVLGGNYFRVLAQDQVYGLSARGLAIDTALEGKTEEFPNFTDWWLGQPAANANQLVLDAVLDSPSVAGAYEFKIRPGSVTSIDIHASLYFRKAVARLGLAPFSSMYLYGENAKNHFGDSVHPEIHDSDGVLFHNSHDEWLWRPLQQTLFLQQYAWPDENPRGFGLLQRDRNFQDYQDLDARYNVRPSVWVTPHGQWGKGVVQLAQLPTNNTNTDNVVLFWRPDRLPQAGEHITLDYTIDFYMNDAARPPLAYTRETFINDPAPPPAPGPSVSPGSPPTLAGIIPVPPPAAKKPAPAPNTTPVQFLVDFIGNGLENIPANAPPDLELMAQPPGTIIRESKVEKNGYDSSWRVTFTIIPLKHFVPTELTCRLMPHNTTTHLRDDLDQLHAKMDLAQQTNDVAGLANLRNNLVPQKERSLRDAETRPLTETWTYTWHQ